MLGSTVLTDAPLRLLAGARNARQSGVALYAPLAVLGLGLGLAVAVILVLNDGVFSYTLDDPYIHLALAEEIARGHYGISPGVFAAPASSILWPLLLAPWSQLAVTPLVPLAYNVVLAVGVVWVIYRVLLRVLDAEGQRDRRVGVAILGAALVIGLHLIGLVLNGMEHVLQLLVSVVAVWGLVREREMGEVAWWLIAALALAPLVRYEGLALTVPALAYLVYRRHVTAALVVAVAAAIPLAAFSLFLLSQGYDAFPTSVLLKSQVLGEGGGMLTSLARNLVENMRLGTGRVLAVALLALLGVAVVRGPERADKALALWAAAALGLHLTAGQLGWFGRYEVYVWAVAVLVLLYVLRHPVRRLVDGQPTLRLTLLTSLALVLTCQNYLRCTLLAPVAANNIYEQHFQMHRFAADYWQGPVGVNDIGWVSFQNDAFVLDFNGLAHRRTLDVQAATDDWVDVLTEEAGVRFLMNYDSDHISPAWIRLGTLHLSRPAITPAGSAVTFFARDEATAEQARALLPDYVRRLPPRVRFEPSL